MASRLTARVREGEGGQAAVALIAIVPALILLTLACAQFALAGHAALSAANAARAAARAAYSGSDPTAAARAALPDSLRAGARVRSGEEGTSVEIEAPRALPFLPAIEVSGSAWMGPEGGAPDG